MRPRTPSKGRLAIVHVARSRLGMDETAYRALLARCAGVQSAKELDEAGFEAVMSEMKRLGFSSGDNTRKPKAALGMATPRQLSAIRACWHRYSGANDLGAMHRFIEEKFGVSHTRFLDSSTAGKVVSVLQSMVAWRERDGDRGAKCVDVDAFASLDLEVGNGRHRGSTPTTGEAT